MHTELSRSGRGRPWRITIGRPYPGSYGIARSYEEARDGFTMAARLHLDTPVIPAEDLLIYRVLLRDQPAIADHERTAVPNRCCLEVDRAAMLALPPVAPVVGWRSSQRLPRDHYLG